MVYHQMKNTVFPHLAWTSEECGAVADQFYPGQRSLHRKFSARPTVVFEIRVDGRSREMAPG